MSVFIWMWQKVPMELGLENDMMLVAVVAGLFSGIGSGLVSAMVQRREEQILSDGLLKKNLELN